MTTIAPEATPTESALPADFHAFYDQFLTDSLYQMSHISFPLQGIKKSQDTTKVGEEGIWQPEDWKLHKPFNDFGGTFERSFTNDSGIVTEYITGNGGMFSLEKRYAKLAGEWHLIYYQDLLMHG